MAVSRYSDLRLWLLKINGFMVAVPQLKLSDGRICDLPKAQAVISIGRGEQCDIAVQADIDTGISRKHCEIKSETEGVWLLTDCSTNGTLLKTADGHLIDLYDIPDRSISVCAGDRIEIPARPSVLLTLTLEDPNRTHNHVRTHERRSALHYVVNLERRVLCCTFRGKQWDHPDSHNLRQQAMALLLYMGQRNQAQNGAVICTKDELIAAVWADLASDRSEQDLIGLVAEVRKSLGITHLIETRKGMGYVLHASTTPR